ncbi:MAG: hypothetical protein RLZZ609_2981 [Cyanobacteriota bacterium]
MTDHVQLGHEHLGHENNESHHASASGDKDLSLEILQKVVGGSVPRGFQLQDALNFNPPTNPFDCLACGLNGSNPGN